MQMILFCSQVIKINYKQFNMLHNYSDKWKLLVNPQKTKLMAFKKKRGGGSGEGFQIE